MHFILGFDLNCRHLVFNFGCDTINHKTEEITIGERRLDIGEPNEKSRKLIKISNDRIAGVSL